MALVLPQIKAGLILLRAIALYCQNILVVEKTPDYTIFICAIAPD